MRRNSSDENFHRFRRDSSDDDFRNHDSDWIDQNSQGINGAVHSKKNYKKVIQSNPL
jgi:hypothetical protein